jgi:hypothetical protein
LNAANCSFKRRLSGGDSDLPVRARIAEAKGDVEFAISLLRDEKDADSRSTLLDILFRRRDRDAALAWLAEEKVDVPDLTVNGVHTLSLCHLQRLDVESVRIALGQLTPAQGKEGPYLLFLRAAASLASVLPIPEHDLPLTGLPLEVMRARVVLPDAEAAARLDRAAADLGTFMPIAATLGMREAKRLAEAYASWCELLHPYRKAAGLARLRSEMKDPKTALARLQFALAYDPEFRPDDVAQYLERREQLGGLDDSEIRAMLVLRLHGNNPGAVAALIARYRMKLEAAFPPLPITPIEIQALAKAGDAPSARLLLNAHADQFSADARAGLEAEVAKAEGADPIQEDLRVYETTKSVEALRSLLASVGSRGDDRAVARCSEELYQRTQDPQHIARAARALTNVGDSKEFLRVMGAYPFLQGRDTALARRYGWELFHSGKLKEAKDIAERLEKWVPPARDLNLEIAIAIESGEWESLAVTLAAFLEDTSKHSALELIRAASLAQASRRGPMMDLLKAAVVAKAEPDPNVWLGAYRLIIEEGLEDDVPEAHGWFQRALTLSDSGGPVQRFELKDLLPQQQEWNERTRTISDSIVRGEIPLIIAATGLRTTVLDILLRNLIRNSALTDPRKRVAVPLFSGTRAPAKCGTLNCLAIDISALMVMGWLGILPTVFGAFPQIALPATILSELFEGRRRIQQVQKSRIKRAAELEQAIARRRLKVTRTAELGRDALSDEVGPTLAGFIRAAEAANGVVLRPAPVHRPGLDQIDADVSAHTTSLSDMQTLLAVLVDRGAVDQAKEETAKRYFNLQDKGWESPARPDPDRPLFIDGLALVYLQYTDLLDTVLNVFKDVHIEANTQDEALVIIENNRHVTEALAKIDEIRTVIRDANAAGKIVFGPRREERDENEGPGLSTLHLLSDLSGADAVVCDDRALNKDAFAQDVSGKRIRALTTLDIIEELKSQSLITEAERRSMRHRLRAGGAVLMPMDAAEIANATMRSGAVKSAELKAIQESVDLARVAEVPAFPRELPWFAALNMAAKAAIMEVWKTEPDRERAVTIADMLLELYPNPEDWIACWGSNPPPNWVDAVRSISVASLSIPVELADDQLVAAYNDWLEARLLKPMRATEPQRYQRVVAQMRSFIDSAQEGDDEETT